MITMTATVYLDSSDFSNMAAAKNQYWIDAKEKLLKKIRENTIEVRFSIFHIMEITHTDVMHKEYAVERAKIIAEICGEKCMYSWQEIIINEIENTFRKNKKTSREIACRDDGIWTAIVRDPVGAVEREFAKGLQEIYQKIENNINNNGKFRAERRRELQIWRKEFDVAMKKRQGTLWRGIISNYDKATNEGLCRKIGFHDTDRGFTIFRGWLEGAVSNRKLEYEIVNSTLNVVNFVDFFYKKTANAAGYFESMRNVGNVVFEEIGKFRVAIAEFSEKYGSESTDKYVSDLLKTDPVAKIRESLLCAVRNHFSEFFVTRISDQEYKSRIVQSSEGEIPSLDTMMQGLRYYMARMLTAERQRKLKKSDIADIMHLSYARYVDLFRTDAYASQMARKITQNNDVKIVTFEQILEIT